MSDQREIRADNLIAHVFETRDQMGQSAATYVATRVSGLLAQQDDVRLVVGSAPSQDEFFDALTSEPIRSTIDWTRVDVFHMDEYIGLPAGHPQTFRGYQEQHLLSKVTPRTFHPIRGEAGDIEAECDRLTALLAERPIDLVCLGIGENGHLAFNDPPVDFDDDAWVRVVTLDSVCRQQQVNDGCFDSLDDVPTQAITLTMRVFREARVLSGVIPGPTKSDAVRATLRGPVTGLCPASMMRDHADARLFLDVDAARLV